MFKLAPAQEYVTVPNTVMASGFELEVEMCEWVEDQGWFSVRLPESHPFKRGDVLLVEGRHGVSKVLVEGEWVYIETPAWSQWRPPFCEDLKVIPRGEYGVIYITTGSRPLAVLSSKTFKSPLSA